MTMAKAAGIIITVVATIVAASIGILLWTVLSKRILRTQKSTVSIVIPMMLGVVLLIIVGLIVIIFFPQFVHK